MQKELQFHDSLLRASLEGSLVVEGLENLSSSKLIHLHLALLKTVFSAKIWAF